MFESLILPHLGASSGGAVEFGLGTVLPIYEIFFTKFDV